MFRISMCLFSKDQAESVYLLIIFIFVKAAINLNNHLRMYGKNLLNLQDFRKNNHLVTQSI